MAVLQLVKTKDKSINFDTKKILRSIKAGNHTFVNDMTNWSQKLEGYVVIDNKYVCPIHKNAIAFDLKPIYFGKEDKKLHMAQGSIGPVFVNRGYQTIKQAVSMYNKKLATSTIKGGLITELVLL